MSSYVSIVTKVPIVCCDWLDEIPSWHVCQMACLLWLKWLIFHPIARCHMACLLWHGFIPRCHMPYIIWLKWSTNGLIFIIFPKIINNWPCNKVPHECLIWLKWMTNSLIIRYHIGCLIWLKWVTNGPIVRCHMGYLI